MKQYTRMGDGSTVGQPLPSAIPADARVVSSPSYGRIACGGLLLAFVGWVVVTLASGQLNWGQVPGYFVDPRILSGVVSTLELTVVAMLLGIAVGIPIAVMRQSASPMFRIAAVGYVWVFRAVPTLVQLLLWFNLALLVPRFTIPGLVDADVNSVMTPFVAALLGLGLAEGAYMAEIVRGGIEGVDKGQIEAAKSLGMTPSQTMRRIVLPQATRIIVPPTGNETINMLKYTSLAFVIAYSELLSAGKKIYTVNFQVLEVLLACSAWYLLLVAALSIVQRQLEARLARNMGRVSARRTRRKRRIYGDGGR